MSNIFQIENVEVVSDSGWSADKGTSIPRRGITDFNRDIVFNRELSDGEVLSLRKWLAANNCPGWTGVWISQRALTEGQFNYRCRTTMDSSD